MKGLAPMGAQPIVCTSFSRRLYEEPLAPADSGKARRAWLWEGAMRLG